MDEVPDEAAGAERAADDRALERVLPVPVPVGTGLQPWRQRAGALAATLPQLARNPVVVSASTVAVTLAARLALEVARRALAAPASTGPARLGITGQLTHHVHVHHHVHVVHHAAAPIGWLALPAPPRR